MNPISLILIGLGLILIYVGWKGSQHTVFATLLGHNTSTTAKKTSNTSGSTSTSQPTSTNASTGNNGSSVESV